MTLKTNLVVHRVMAQFSFQPDTSVTEHLALILTYEHYLWRQKLNDYAIFN